MNNKIKIAQFNRDDFHGGAGKASHRLFNSLKDKNEVYYFVKNKTIHNENIIKLNQIQNDSLDKIESIINNQYIHKNRTSISNTLFSISLNNSNLPNLNNYDIINLHWVNFFLSFNNLYELTKLNKPIVWTLHDMESFTGGCHYANICTNFENNCKNCMQLLEDKLFLPNKILKLKNKIFKNANITLVSPSKWLAKEVKKSKLFSKKEVVVIPNGIDSNIFKAYDKKVAKKTFDIDENKIVLGFGAVHHKEKRKGFKELLEALSKINTILKEKDIIGLTFGNADDSLIDTPIINIGNIQDEDVLSKAYSACDIFILPSLEDNLPNTILESLSCETPVIAFDTGGIKDIISNEVGIVVKKGNSSLLASAILNLINDQELRKKMGKRGRIKIKKEYQDSHQAKRYEDLYKKLINKQNNTLHKEDNIESSINKIIGSIYLKYADEFDQKKKFNQQIRNFYSKISNLDKNLIYIIYGNGSIGKIISSILDKRIKFHFVDNRCNTISNNIYPLKSLESLKYDKIIISVLGKEEEIINFLIEELNIHKNKIITMDIS